MFVVILTVICIYNHSVARYVYYKFITGNGVLFLLLTFISVL